MLAGLCAENAVEQGDGTLPPRAVCTYSKAMSQLIYKIAPRSLWAEAEAKGMFTGAPVDIDDGYIHFSTAEQALETAAKHFVGQHDLVLAAIEADRLGEALVWEASRGGALFPHLYAALPMDAVRWVKPLPIGTGGAHEFPEMDG